MGKSVRNTNNGDGGFNFDDAFQQATSSTKVADQPKNGKKVTPEKKAEVSKDGFDFDAAFSSAVKKKDEPTAGNESGNGITNSSPSTSTLPSDQKEVANPESPFDFKSQQNTGGLSQASTQLRAQNNFLTKKLTKDDIQILAPTEFGVKNGLNTISTSPAAKEYFIAAHNGPKESELVESVTKYLPADAPDLSKAALSGDVNAIKKVKTDLTSSIDKQIEEINSNKYATTTYGTINKGLTPAQETQIELLNRQKQEAENTLNQYAENSIVNKKASLLSKEGTDEGMSPGMLAKEIGKQIEQEVLPDKFFENRENAYQAYRTFPLIQQQAKDKVKTIPGVSQSDIDAQLKELSNTELYAKENIEYDREQKGVSAILTNLRMKANDMISKGFATQDPDLIKKANDILNKGTSFKEQQDKLLDSYPDVGIAQAAQILSDRISTDRATRPIFISNSDIQNATASENEQSGGEFSNKYGKFINYVAPSMLPKGGLAGNLNLGIENAFGNELFGTGSNVEEVARSYNPALKTTAQSGGQASKIAYDNDGKAYRELPNENYSTWDFNNSMRVVGHGLPELAKFVLLERGIGGIAGLAGEAGVGTLTKIAQVGSKLADVPVTAEELATTREALKFSKGLKETIGLTGAMYVTSYDQNRKLADDLIEGKTGKDEFKKDVLANAMTLLSAAAFKVVGYSPSQTVEAAFAKGIAPDALKIIETEGLQGLSKEETNQLFKDIILPKAEAMAKSLGVSIKGGATGAAGVVLDKNVQGLLASIVNPDKGHLPTAREDVDATISQIMLMTVAGLPGMVGAKTHGTLTKDALYEAGLRYPQFEGIINKGVEDGKYTTVQANEMISTLKTMGEEAYKAQNETTKDGLPLTTKQKRDLAFNNFKIRAAKMLEAKGHPIDTKTIEAETIKQNDDIRQEIKLEPVTVETDESGALKVNPVSKEGEPSANETDQLFNRVHDKKGDINVLLDENKKGESVDFLKDQVLTTPHSIFEKLDKDEALTTDLIAANGKEKINDAISKLETKQKDPETTDQETEEIDKHLSLLDKGLQKADILESKNQSNGNEKENGQKSSEEGRQKSSQESGSEENAGNVLTKQENGAAETIGTEAAPIPEKPKASDRLREISKTIREKGLHEALPNWAKADLPEGTQAAGFGGKALDHAIAKAIDIVADAIDTGKEVAEAIKSGFEDLRNYYQENTKSFDEEKLRNDFESFFKDKGLEENVSSKQELPPTEKLPIDQAQKESNITGLRKSILNKEHLQPEVEAGINNAVRGHEEVWNQVVAEAKAGTFEPTQFRSDILERIDKGEKVSLTDTDAFKLLYDRKNIQNDIAVLNKEMSAAIESKDVDKQADVAEQLEYQNTQLDLNRLAIRKSGKETGRGVSALQAITDLDDLQLLKWTEELKKQFGVDSEEGIPSSAKKFIDELDKKYKETFDKLNDHIDKLKQEAAEAKLKADKAVKNTGTIKEKGKQIADTIRKLKQPKGGAKMDFTLGTWDLAVEGVAKLVEAGASIADAVKQLVDEGKIAFKTDKDRNEFEDHLVNYKRNSIADEIVEISEKNKATTITKDTIVPLRKLIKEYSKDDKYNTLKEVVDAVHSKLSSDLPDLTERDIRDAYSGYGINPETKQNVQSDYQKLKDQAKKVSQYQDARKELEKLQKTPEKNVGEQERLVKKINSLYDDVKSYMASQGMIAQPATQPDVQAKQIDELNKRLQNKIDEKQRKLDANDFEEPEKPKDVYGDATTVKLQGQLKQLNKEFNARKAAFEYYNKSGFYKILSTGAQLKRSFVLSHITTLAKLGAALTENIAITPIRETIGATFYGINKGIDLAMQKGLNSSNPVYHNLILKADRQGVPSWIAEGAAWKALGKGGRAWNDFISEAKNGYIELGLLYGKDVLRDAPEEYKTLWTKLNRVLDYPGQVHAAIKSIPKRTEFERSYVLRKESAQRKGLNVSDPVIQSDIATQAYDDATASILMKDNLISKAWSDLIKKGWNSGNIAGQTAAFIGSELMPIVKVPTNLVLEGGRYTVGAHGAAIRIGLGVISDVLNRGLQKIGAEKAGNFVARAGLEKLTPEQADNILSNLKKGGVSLALNILATALPGIIKVSPFYHKGLPKKDDLKEGELEIAGVKIPKILQDHPLFLSMRVHETASQLYDHYREKYNEESKLKTGWYSGVGTLKGLANETPFMQNTSNVMALLERPDSKQTDHFVDNFVQSTVEPGILIDIAKMHDSKHWYDPFVGQEKKRTKGDLGDYMKSGVPGLREELPLKE